MRNFQKTHSSFDQTSAQKTALTKFTTVTIAQVRRFLVKLEGTAEHRSAQLHALLNRRYVLFDLPVGCRVGVSKCGQQSIAPRFSNGGDPIRTC